MCLENREAAAQVGPVLEKRCLQTLSILQSQRDASRYLLEERSRARVRRAGGSDWTSEDTPSHPAAGRSLLLREASPWGETWQADTVRSASCPTPGRDFPGDRGLGPRGSAALTTLLGPRSREVVQVGSSQPFLKPWM